MRAVGSYEVDDRGRVLEVHAEVDPVLVGVELCIAVGDFLELGARRIEARKTCLAATSDVQCRKVERNANQMVAQNVGDELVDLVADLAGHAANDGARTLISRDRARGIGCRVQEGGEEIH